MVARNLVYRQRAGGKFEAGPLCRNPVGLLFTGVLADFDGDGAADLVAASFEGVFFFKGSSHGTFDEATRLALADWAGRNNLEGRLRDDDRISQHLVMELRDITPEVN